VKLDPEMVEHEHLIQDATGKSEEISSVNSNSNLKTKYNEVLEVENCNLFSDYEIMENVLVDPDSRSSPIMGTGNMCASTFKTNQRSLLKRPAEPVTLANISPPTSNLDQFLKMAGEHQARKHNEARRVAEVAAAPNITKKLTHPHGNTKTAFRSILNLNRGPEIRKRIIRVRKSNLPYPEAGTESYRPIKNIRERLRRKEMTDLYSELQNLVDFDMVKLDKIGRVSVGKMSYEDTMNAARTCIGRLEAELGEQNSEYRAEERRNQLLRLELKRVVTGNSEAVLEPCDEVWLEDQLLLPPPPSLLACPTCSYQATDIRKAFVHFQEHGAQERSDALPADPITVVTRSRPGRRGSGGRPAGGESLLRPASQRPDLVGAGQCPQCPFSLGPGSSPVCLQLHSFLHSDLTYFGCGECEAVFGLPSKLRHHRSTQHNSQESESGDEANAVLSYEARLELTARSIQQVQQHFLGRTAASQLETDPVNNFLEASLDARLILDELALYGKVEEGEDTKETIDEILRQFESDDG